MRVFAALFLVLGVILLGAAVVAVIRGVIWRDPFRVKLDPRWCPGRWVYRDDEPRQFWLDVAWHAPKLEARMKPEARMTNCESIASGLVIRHSFGIRVS
jgi:hypothetical protein